jgi:hypothetical protein
LKTNNLLFPQATVKMKVFNTGLVFATLAAVINGAALPQMNHPLEPKAAMPQMNHPLEPKAVPPPTEPFTGVELPLPWQTAAPALVRKADEPKAGGNILAKGKQFFFPFFYSSTPKLLLLTIVYPLSC